jgi:hypothetical protein
MNVKQIKLLFGWFEQINNCLLIYLFWKKKTDMHFFSSCFCFFIKKRKEKVLMRCVKRLREFFFFFSYSNLGKGKGRQTNV